jgi:hypothetical protein
MQEFLVRYALVCRHDCTMLRFAMAADIPPELFDRMLNYLTWDATLVAAYHLSDERKEKKRILGRCSLTCRYWASRCRIQIFNILTIRSLVDLQSLLGFTPIVRSYIEHLFLEETEPCIPWTHHVYMRIRDGVFPQHMFVTHTLDGACTPTSVQRLRSLHQSLPRQPPVFIWDNHTVCVSNYRLETFSDDIAQLVRRFRAQSYWELKFTNVSWIKEPDTLPTVLQMKKRAMCHLVTLKECPDRWPFVWLFVTTKTPEQHRNSAFIEPDEALRLVFLLRCLTSTHPDRKSHICTITDIHRMSPPAMYHYFVAVLSIYLGSGPGLLRDPTRFTITIICREVSTCTPHCKLTFWNGRLRQWRMEFNTDTIQGFTPLDFDWETFDGVAAHATHLTRLTVCVEEDPSYVSEMATGMYTRLKNLHNSGKLVIEYDHDGKRPTWVPLPPADEEAPGDPAPQA